MVDELSVVEVKGGAKSSEGVNGPRGAEDEMEGGGSAGVAPVEDNWEEGGDRVSPAGKEGGGPLEESVGTLGERPLKRDNVPGKGSA